MPALNLPTPGVTPGTNWAFQVNGAFNSLNDYVETGRLSATGLNSQYPVYRLWTGTGYPDRIAGAVNIFLGPVDPGLKMADNDRWANPNVTTLATVVAQMNNTSSDLYAATVAASAGHVARLQLSDRTSSVVERTTFGADNNVTPAWLFPAGSGSTLYGTTVIPPGWTTARLVIVWVQSTSESGSANVRFQVRSASVTAGSVISGGKSWESSQPVAAVDVVNKTPVVTLASIVQREIFSVRIARNGTSSTDTLTGPVYLIDAYLERTS